MRALTILLLLCCVKERSGFLFNVVKDYLEMQHLRIAIFITCDDTRVSGNILQDKRFKNELEWLLIYDLSIKTLSEKNEELKTLFKFDSHRKAVIYDMECEKTMEFFEMISVNNFFNASYNWLIFGSSLAADRKILKDQGLNVDAEMSLLIPDTSNSTAKFLVYDVYNPFFVRGGKLNITYKGMWTESSKFQIVFWQKKNEQRNNFNGLQMRGGIAVTRVPRNMTFYEYIESTEYPDRDTINRYTYHLYKYIMDKYNFSMDVVRSDRWGNESPNHTWDGVFGLLQRKEIDIGITPSRFEINRIAITDPIIVHLVAVHAILLRHPKNSGMRNIFLQPFDTSVWISCAIMLLTVAVVIFITFSVENFMFFEKKLQLFIDTQTISLFHSLLISLAFLFQQGFDGPIRLASSKIIIMSMLFFSLLLYQYYSAFIVGSLLTVPPRNIKTAQDLIDSNLAAGAEDIAYTVDYFKGNYTKYSNALYLKKMQGKPNDNIFPVEEGVKLIKREGFAFYMDMATGYKIVADTFTEEEVCDLQLIHLHIPRHAASKLAKGSPLKELFRYIFRQMVETGITSHEEPYWQRPKPPCVKKTLDVAKVDVKTISSIIIIFNMGILLSLLMLLLEIIYNKIQKNMQARK